MTTGVASDVLAIDGGKPVRTDPWPPRHLFGQEEKRAVVALFDRCIETGHAFGYGGPEEQAFCEEFAQELGGGYADGVNSGTSTIRRSTRRSCGSIPGGYWPSTSAT